MYKQMLNVCIAIVALFSQGYFVLSSDAPADTLSSANRYNAPDNAHAIHLDKIAAQQHSHAAAAVHQHAHHYQQAPHHHVVPSAVASGHAPSIYHPPPAVIAGGSHLEKRNSYNLLSEAMSQAVSNEFNSLGSGSADGACHADDLECYTNSVQDRLGMEAIRTLHRQLDDDDNGNIDLSESDDFLREELKYDSGYEKRQKAFHFNDDMHISVKELWEAWLRSEVHNWTIEQTTDWLAQSVQLPQYVELFKLHKVTGAALPRLAVNNMHYVGNVLGIKDPIHKQKIALKAMDVVLFGPPRETGTRWKDYILVTLLLSAIIGCWYAYQQNKNAKRHLRRMAQDMEGLQRAEQSLQEMQKELERARMEQESVETEKLDLERRLKEAPLLSSSSSDLEVQQLKKEIEMLRNELSRAEIELVDNCWTPPPQLQSWLQYTYELESKNHLKKRMSAEKQLQSAREACEKLRKKRSSLVGAFVSTHGKSIDDVDRSIVEARNSLGEVTNELQERLHRWKQIEQCLGFNVVNNNGLPYLESILYGRNGGIGGGGSNASSKGSRGRITNSTDDLDDESVAGMLDSYSRSSLMMNNNATNASCRDDSSSEDGIVDTTQAVQFYLGNVPPTTTTQTIAPTPEKPPRAAHLAATTPSSDIPLGNHVGGSASILPPTPISTLHLNNAQFPNFTINDSQQTTAATLDNSRHSPSVSSEGSLSVPPRSKKLNVSPDVVIAPIQAGPPGRAPMPPPRKAYQSHMLRSQSSDLAMPMEVHNAYYARQQQQQQSAAAAALQQQHQFHGGLNAQSSSLAAASGNTRKTMVKQHSTASQQSSSSTSSSVQSAPPVVTAIGVAHIDNGCIGQHTLPLRWSTPERNMQSTAAAAAIKDLQPNTVQQSSKSATFGLQTLSSNLGTNAPTTAAAAIIALNTTATGANNGSNSNITSNETAASFAAPSHGHTELDKSRQTSNSNSNAADTVSLTDTVSLDGSIKKRRRRLRFPFGGSSKKSSSNSRDSINDDAANSNSSKAKHA